MQFFKIICTLLTIIFLCVSGCSKEPQKTPEELNQQALSLLQNKQPDQALETIGQALETATKKYGADHPALVPSLEIQGFIYQTQGKPAKAESAFLEALNLLSRSKAPNRGETAAKILNTLGGLYFAGKQYGPAAETFRKSLTIAQNLFPENDPRIKTLHKNIQTCEIFLSSDNTPDNTPDGPNPETDSLTAPQSADTSAPEIQDYVPDSVKQAMMARLEDQNITIKDLSPKMPIRINDKGMVFPYHALQKNPDNSSQELMVLFAATASPENPGAMAFRECRLIPYANFQATLQQGNITQIQQELVDLFADLYATDS